MAQAPWQLWIDTGGTFTDCLAQAPDRAWKRVKVLSSSSLRGTVLRVREPGEVELAFPLAVPPDFFVGMRVRVLGESAETQVVAQCLSPLRLTLEAPLPGIGEGVSLELLSEEEAPILAARLATQTPRQVPLPPIHLRLATTKGTNSLLEENGAPVLFCVTEGFGDLLRIGDQRRPDLFALNPARPDPLHAAVLEVPERLTATGDVLRPMDEAKLSQQLREVPEEMRQVAVVALLHSDLNPIHELALARLLREAGFGYVVTSAELAARIKIVPRAETALVDGYLGPLLKAYLDDVAAELGETGDLRVMTSAGGLVPRSAYRPKDSLLSGPAGGLVGAASAARVAGYQRALIFDMGGTSTDVARFDGVFRPAPTHRVGRAELLSPALEIESVAAGGGSICRYVPGTASLQVGPESAGASPGPACYGAGGPLTITDVNLLLGRLDPDAMSIPVDVAAARVRLQELENVSGTHDAELLTGLVRIANEHMADAIRTISVREGYRPSEYALVAFGGAGGLHACGIAELLGIETILYPPDSGLLSARGLREAVPERRAERQVLQTLAQAEEHIASWQEELEAEAIQQLREDVGIEVVSGDVAFATVYEAELRLPGQDATLQIAFKDPNELAKLFEQRYRAMFNYAPEPGDMELVALRVSVALPSEDAEGETFPEEAEQSLPTPTNVVNAPDGTEVPAYRRDELTVGMTCEGPAIIQDMFSTFFLAAGWCGQVGSSGTLKVVPISERAFPANAGVASAQTLEAPEAVETELYRHRFAHLVDEMGELLRRTARSTNVKERLDFSCALLSPAGELVMNAPHIPVHLGALGVCVRRVTAQLPLGPGDVAVVNHPAAGGSHLPDVTLLAPVFATPTGGELLGYVANRAHHAELGGIVPGSMPATAKNLAEEGVVIAPLKLVTAGEARWEEMREVLCVGPFPSRHPEENLADLHAQLASINRGAELLRELADSFGTETVRHQMERLLSATAEAVTIALRNHLAGQESLDVVEKLDDGTPICLRWREEGTSWVLDFTGTGGGALAHPGNFNATEAVVRSAVIYGLRLLVGGGFELNEGLMRPVRLQLPTCFLSPEFVEDPTQCPAVVAGNVETSQRVVDTLLRLLGLAAGSQGTMNNFIFGNEHVSYYETICGGAGATAIGPGASALHTHMTNTAITDPEVLERRYPVRLERFAIRPSSGGAGQYEGGDGAIREVVFLDELTLNLLTQHRVEAPYGLVGGEPGERGRQRLVRAEGSEVALEPNVSCPVGPGDRLILETPGGGGWGVASSA